MADPTKRGSLGRALPWAIAAGCAGLASWLGLRTPLPPAGTEGDAPSPGAAAGSPAPGQERAACPPPDLAPLRRCLGRLELARRERAAEDRPAASEAAAGSGGALEPRLDEHVQARADRILAVERAAREQVRFRRLESALSLIEDELGLGEEESAWLGEYVCAVRELREDSLVDLAERDAGAPADVWEQMRQEREEALGGLAAVLGPERFERLRAVGGIGLLNDLLDCDDGP